MEAGKMVKGGVRHRRGISQAASLIALVLAALSGTLFGSASALAAGCANEAFRTDFSASLPDCRAYELVTPPDLNGRVPLPISNNFESPHNLELFPTELLTPSRTGFLYMTHQSPPLESSGPNGMSDLLEAQRTSQGWSTTRRLNPSGAEAVFPHPGGASPDHEFYFLSLEGKGSQPVGTLGSEGTASFLGAPDGSFELVGMGDLGSERFAQGRYIGESGRHVIFTTGKESLQSLTCHESPPCQVRKLEENAPETGTGAVYDREADGLTHVVSLLPPSQTPAPGQQAFYKGVSKDASSVAFEIGGTLYVRVQIGDASSEKSEEVAPGYPVYAGISEDGRYVVYVEGGEKGTIHRFDTADESDEKVNPTAEGEVVNVSADGSHVYFIAEEEIGGEGESGAPNLYVWSAGGGSPRYVTTVASGDLEGIPALNRWTSMAVAPIAGVGLTNSLFFGPGDDSSRSTPDGHVLIFESKAALTGYENAGNSEIYRYEDGHEGVVCVSCSPLVEPATTDARLQELRLVPAGIVLHNVSDDGSRVFFETTQRLVPQDSDGVNDIYEWKQEEGGSPSVSLISSGQSTQYLPPPEQAEYGELLPNVLYSVSAEGDDVIFFAQDPLVPAAGVGGTPALYDARVDGGFPQPTSPLTCSEEACRPIIGSQAPSFLGTSSETTQKGGNAKPAKHHAGGHRHRCHRQGRRDQGRAKRPCTRHHHRRHHSRGAAATLSSAPTGQLPQQELAPTSKVGDISPQSRTISSPVAAGAGQFNEFGIKAVSAERSTTGAGDHPDFTTLIELNSFLSEGNLKSDARTQEIAVSLPPGLLGNPNAVARCNIGELLAFASCSPKSQIGVARVIVSGVGPLPAPIYNLAPPHPDKEIARFGFQAEFYPVFIDVTVRTSGDYGVTATAHDSPAQASLLRAMTTFWGNPSDPVHDPQRFSAAEALQCEGAQAATACEQPGGKREVPRTGVAFMTNPSACQEGVVGFTAKSYQFPGRIFERSAPLGATTVCQGLPFEPNFTAEPTSHIAGASAGLSTKLVIPPHEGADEKATATMREARVTLPAGMQVNAAAANWIGTCSDRQMGFHEEVDAQCPDNSKLGTVTIKSPAISLPIEGSLYQRTPSPGHQFGLWLAADVLGLHIKIPGELEPDPASGRLTAVFSDLPQVPVSEIDLNIWGGPRAPLQNPDHCGSFATDYSFATHSADSGASGQSQMQITEGCNQPFDPTLHAGVTTPVAAKYSPLVVDLNRPDGDQALRGFELELPDGQLAKLKGVPLCPDAAAQGGACPAGSAIGHILASSGTGPEPLWLPQPGKSEPEVYLAGPYQGFPFSVVTEVPAQAGPFDLGTVTVRSGLGLDPETNRAVIKADPLPRFFEGIGLSYRQLHVVIDRQHFALNGTDCRDQVFNSTITSSLNAATHPAPRFQLKGCKRLGFKPELQISLRGATGRAAYPALTALVRARKGDANIARTSVALPHSEFLAQEHIGTICTRKQFAANRCPKGSIYGRAKAWTPLLSKPLSGPVYLRSSDHPLPDLVVALGGELDVNLVGRIDSDKAGGIRTTFESVPDAPVTKFVLKMSGGRKSLLTNSTDICSKIHRATVKMRAQNGRELNFRPALSVKRCGRAKR